MRITDGAETCIVGYLPRNVVARGHLRFDDKYAQILELYKESSNTMKRQKSHRNMEMASYQLLDLIPGGQ